MKELYEMYASLGISREVYEFGQSVLDGLRERFDGIDAVAEYNQAKVIRAMQEHRCLLYTSAEMAMEALSGLRGGEVHSSVILSSVDENTFKKLGMHVTYEPVYQSHALYHK